MSHFSQISEIFYRKNKTSFLVSSETCGRQKAYKYLNLNLVQPLLPEVFIALKRREVCAAINQLVVKDAINQLVVKDAINQLAVKDAINQLAVKDAINQLTH